MVKLEILGLTLYGELSTRNPEDDTFRTGIFVEPALARFLQYHRTGQELPDYRRTQLTGKSAGFVVTEPRR